METMLYPMILILQYRINLIYINENLYDYCTFFNTDFLCMGNNLCVIKSFYNLLKHIGTQTKPNSS